MKPVRLNSLPERLRLDLKAARKKRGWSQAELGQRAGLPQAHISGIETGRIVPRFNTLIDLVRTLEHDLVLVPRSLVPAVNALVRDSRDSGRDGDVDERPLYARDDESRGGGGEDS